MMMMILNIAMAFPALLFQASPSTLEASGSQQSSGQDTQATATTQVDTAQTTKVTDVSIVVTDKSDPNYVRCRSSREIGSLAKRKKTCMTNREWEEIARAGNRGARDIVESQQVGTNGQ